jgi:cytochrome b pre-mRNA-processing protein 3
VSTDRSAAPLPLVPNPPDEPAAVSILARLFRRAPGPEAAATDLYRAVVEQARQPAFYTQCGVPDSVDGRFDLIVLHAFLLFRRLKDEGAPGEAVSQAVFDTMMADMDVNLREMGVGDLGVGKRIKKMANAFYGRLKVYDRELDPATQTDDGLATALRRNLWGAGQAPDAGLDAIAAYVRQTTDVLADQPGEALIAGRVDFPPAPEPDAAPAVPAGQGAA